MTQRFPLRPVVLCILDGWGHREACENNAICMGKTPNYDRLLAAGPNALIDASGAAVGLPQGQMGNSEVGHMNIGAGRTVLQHLPRIDAAIAKGNFHHSPELQTTIAALKESGGRAHIMGLLSPGGVHSHQDHIAALLKVFQSAGVPCVLHAFLDGRDTPPRSAGGYLATLLEAAPETTVATVIGRYFAMDRDNRWDRVAQAYDAMTLGKGRAVGSASEAIDASYAEGVNDEFLAPSIVDGYSGMAVGDGIVMANFRADRAREILQALLDPNFAAFPREKVVSFATALGMVEYSESLNAFLTAIFSPVELTETLGELLAGSGGRQLRIAETEKYAHVTFFFNGGREARFAGEERILIPSPKVATYDLMPEMSADAVIDALLEALAGDGFDLIICNLANGDMVGHSGKLDAAIKAVETLDRCMGRLAEAVHESGGALLITADHGNCEQMLDTQSGQAHTAHTMNKVPLLLVNAPAKIGGLSDGSLADIAPTILELLGMAKPTVMTGHSLLRGLSTSAAAQ